MKTLTTDQLIELRNSRVNNEITREQYHSENLTLFTTISDQVSMLNTLNYTMDPKMSFTDLGILFNNAIKFLSPESNELEAKELYSLAEIDEITDFLLKRGALIPPTPIINNQAYTPKHMVQVGEWVCQNI